MHGIKVIFIYNVPHSNDFIMMMVCAIFPLMRGNKIAKKRILDNAINDTVPIL
jgi:hypothetical protein